MPFVISCLYMAKPELLSHCYTLLHSAFEITVCTFLLVVAWDLLEDIHI